MFTAWMAISDLNFIMGARNSHVDVVMSGIANKIGGGVDTRHSWRCESR